MNSIFNEDCRDTINRIENDSIDMVITSPPYGTMREYKGFQWNFSIFQEIATGLKRILKPGGVIAWIVGDQVVNGSENCDSAKQKLFFYEKLGLRIHDTMIFQKHTGFPSGNNRYLQSFEYIFIISKGSPKTFHKFLWVRKSFSLPGSPKCKTRRGRDGIIREIENHDLQRFRECQSDGHRIAGNVWYYPVGYRHSATNDIAYEHPAIFPENLVIDLLGSWSNENDLVYDPFCGSGTVPYVCLRTNRRYIGSEISQEYCDIIEKRIKIERDQLILF
jgi:site-specific DNA-methyltransferase (adenine-specific)